MADLTYYPSGETAGTTYTPLGECQIRTFAESELTHPAHTDGFVDKGDPVCIGAGIVGMALASASAATDLIDVVVGGIVNVLVDDSATVVTGGPVYLAADNTLSSTYASTSLYYGVAFAPITQGVTAGKVIPVEVRNQVLFAPTQPKTVVVDLAGGLVNTMAFTWQNPEAVPIYVEKVILDITVAGGTAGAVIDVGAVNAATDTANTILNDVDANAAAVSCYTGALKMTAKNGSLDYITGKILTDAAADLAGTVTIRYTVGA